MSDQGMYILANLIKIGQEEILLNGSKALSLSSNSIYTDYGIKFSIPSDRGLLFNGKGINTQNKNKNNQNLTVFPNKNNIGKNKDITVSIPAGSSISGILPDPPTNIVAEIDGSTQIKVTFTPPEFTGGSPITSYTAVVSYDDQKTESSTTPPQTGTSTTSPIIVSGLTPGNTYKIRVYSLNRTGNSDPSLESNSATLITKPKAPSTVSAVAGPEVGQITLSWSAVGLGNNGGLTVTEYRIYQGTNTTSIDTVKTGTSYIVSKLGNGSSHTFKVAAYNAEGEGPGKESNLVSTFSVPGPNIDIEIDFPFYINFRDETIFDSITVNWLKPFDGGTPITSYILKLYNSQDVLLSSFNIANNVLTKTINNLYGSSYGISFECFNMVGSASTSIIYFNMPGSSLSSDKITFKKDILPN
jgi:hypothetical protein